MAYIPVPDTVRAELVYNWDGVVCENILDFEAAAQPTLVTMAELGAHLVNWWDTSMQSAMPTNLSLINVKLTDLSTVDGPVLDYGTGLPLAGLSVSPSLPNNVALVLTKRTALRGRSYRGRVYIPGMVEANVTANTVAGALVTAFITAFGLIKSFSTTTEDWVQGVVSRYNDGNPRITGVITPIVSFTSDGVIDSQRRRLPGRGQ